MNKKRLKEAPLMPTIPALKQNSVQNELKHGGWGK